MKIVSESKGGDFYESFSDLIFGTLIIFLVVVLALMVQVREVTEQHAKKVEGVVTPHRFTGGVGNTKFGYCILPSEITGGDETHVVLIPWDVFQMWNMQRVPKEVDPTYFLAEAFQNDELLILPVSDVAGMAGHLAIRDLITQIVGSPGYGEVMVRLYTAKTRLGDRFDSMTPEAIRDYIGGIYLPYGYVPNYDYRVEPFFDDPDFPFRQQAIEYENWLSGTRDNPINRSETDFISKLREAVDGFEGEFADGIRFSVEEDEDNAEKSTIIIGETRLTVGQFRALLKVIAPGKGFVIEYVGPDGEEGQAAPLWFEEEVLFPSGYDARVLKKPVDNEDDEDDDGDDGDET